MPHEYEMIPHGRYQDLNVVLVHLFARAPHLHHDFELGLVLEGTVELRRGDRSDRIETGDLYLINPMEVHEFRSPGSGVLILAIQTSFRVLSGFVPQCSEPHFTGGAALKGQFAGREADYRLLRRLAVELAVCYLDGGQPNAFHCFSLLAQLLDLLMSELPHGEPGPDETDAAGSRANRMLSILNYIDKNYQRKLLLREVAEQQQLTMVYLSHLFKEMMGVSFQEYLKRRRFEDACRLLLSTDRTVLDISLSCGFSDVRYLTKVFLEMTGSTPTEYRKSGTPPCSGNGSSPFTLQRMLTPADALALLSGLCRKLQDEP